MRCGQREKVMPSLFFWYARQRRALKGESSEYILFIVYNGAQIHICASKCHIHDVIKERLTRSGLVSLDERCAQKACYLRSFSVFLLSSQSKVYVVYSGFRGLYFFAIRLDISCSRIALLDEGFFVSVGTYCYTVVIR